MLFVLVLIPCVLLSQKSFSITCIGIYTHAPFCSVYNTGKLNVGKRKMRVRVRYFDFIVLVMAPFSARNSPFHLFLLPQTSKNNLKSAVSQDIGFLTLEIGLFYF